MKCRLLLACALMLACILPCSSQPKQSHACLNTSDVALIHAYWKNYAHYIPSSHVEYQKVKHWLNAKLIQEEKHHRLQPELYFLLAISHMKTAQYHKAELNFKRVQRIYRYEKTKPEIWQIATKCLVDLKLNAQNGAASKSNEPTSLNVLLKGANTINKHLYDFDKPYILLHFWASWCQPCLQELPQFQAFYKASYVNDLHLKVGIITINNDFGKSSLDTFLTNHPYSFPIYFDPHLKINDHLHLNGSLPQTILFDTKKKKIIKIWIGEQNWTDSTFIAKLNTYAN